jgi:MFS transporter, PPP family, 3-phenylpropionic acid transporter
VLTLRNRIQTAVSQPLGQIRLYFFLSFAAGSFLMPFLPIFYREQGLSGFQIGLLSSIGFAIGMVMAPLWGRWTDRAGSPHRLLQIGVLCGIVNMLILSRQTEFLPMAAIVALNALLSSGGEPISSSLAVRSTRGTRSGFGSIRVWGSLGWAIMVSIAGWMIQRTSLQTAFYGYAAFFSTAWIVLLFYRPQPGGAPASAAQSAAPAGTESPPVRSRALLALFLAMFMSWFAMSGIRQFEVIYLTQLGAGEQLIGFAATLAAAVELPGMFLADRLCRRFGAHYILIFGFFLEGLMRGTILLFPTVTMVIGIRLVTGIAFSLYTVGVIAYVQEIIPSHRQTGMIALYTVVVRNLVCLVGFPLSGIIFDAAGAYWLYGIALAGNLVAGVILLFSGRPTPVQSAERRPPALAAEA